MTPLEQSAHDYAESKSSGFEGQARADKYITCYNAFLAGAGNEWAYLPELPEESDIFYVAFKDFKGVPHTARAFYFNDKWRNERGDIIQMQESIYAWYRPTPPPPPLP